VRVERSGTAVTEIRAGGSFGELCLAGPRSTRSASVVAVARPRSSAWRRTGSRDRRPEATLGTRLLSRFARLVGERQRDLTERLANVERLAVAIWPGESALRTGIVLASRGE